MSKTATEAMTSFTQYLGQEGQAISSALESHFKATDSHLNSQIKGLESINEDARRHNEAVRSIAVPPTATTPTRQSIQPLRERPLRLTRSHSLIVEEVRSGLWRSSILSNADSVSTVSATPLTGNRKSSATTTAKKRRQVKQPLGRLGSYSIDDGEKGLQPTLSWGSGSFDSEGAVGENVPPSLVTRTDSRENALPLTCSTPRKMSAKIAKTPSATAQSTSGDDRSMAVSEV